jgi:hypothetical protein
MVARRIDNRSAANPGAEVIFGSPQDVATRVPVDGEVPLASVQEQAFMSGRVIVHANGHVFLSISTLIPRPASVLFGRKGA